MASLIALIWSFSFAKRGGRGKRRERKKGGRGEEKRSKRGKKRGVLRGKGHNKIEFLLTTKEEKKRKEKKSEGILRILCLLNLEKHHQGKERGGKRRGGGEKGDELYSGDCYLPSGY